MCGNHAGIFQTKKKKKIKQKQCLISAFLLGLAAFFISLLVLNLDFQAWAFKCYQNQLSWHTHPILLLPILFFLIGDKYLVICQYSSSIYQYDLVSCSSDNASLG